MAITDDAGVAIPGHNPDGSAHDSRGVSEGGQGPAVTGPSAEPCDRCARDETRCDCECHNGRLSGSDDDVETPATKRDGDNSAYFKSGWDAGYEQAQEDHHMSGDPTACAKHSFWRVDCSLCDATRSGFERGCSAPSAVDACDVIEGLMDLYWTENGAPGFYGPGSAWAAAQEYLGKRGRWPLPSDDADGADV